MIKQSLGLSSSCHLHLEIGIIRSVAEDVVHRLIEIDILIARDQPEIYMATIVREIGMCIMFFRFIFGGLYHRKVIAYLVKYILRADKIAII